MKLSLSIFAFACSLVSTASAFGSDSSCSIDSIPDSAVVAAAFGTIGHDSQIASLSIDQSTAGRNIRFTRTDRTSVTVAVNLNCSSGLLEARVLANPQDFVCKTGYLNCGMTVGPTINKYCTLEYRNWSKANCATHPIVVQ